MTQYGQVSIRLSTEADQHLQAFDFSTLSAINMCPTWGIIRYGHHKAMPGAGRSMALEAGSACHDVFAAARLYILRHSQGLVAHSDHHGRRLFGNARWDSLCQHLADDGNSERTRFLRFSLEALYTSGFHDDPRDRRRTVTNLEESCITYLDRLDRERWPVWVRDPTCPTSDVGIEVGFDLVITFHLNNGNAKAYRFIGKIDGVHVYREQLDRLQIQENKTASRLNDAWEQSFLMSHQITGYCLAASVWTERACEDAVAIGLAIPLPRTGDLGGLSRVPVKRRSQQFEEFLSWFWHTTQVYEEHLANPAAAPKYTHSCNRYFQPCSMIPYCASDDEERTIIFGEMEEHHWNPLEIKASD